MRCHQPSTVSGRLSIVTGFDKTCVIDGILPHSPADYIRRPTVPAESPTLGLGHLQFEALITTARLSANPNDFALVQAFWLELHIIPRRLLRRAHPLRPWSWS